MSDLVVVVPVLDRPHRAQPLADSLHAASVLDPRLVFVCSPDDTAEVDACQATGAIVLIVDWPAGHADYQRKINLAYQATEEPFLFQAADDLVFEPGWDIAAVDVLERGDAHVVGTNDDANPLVRRGMHATHSLIRRTYIDEHGGSLDGPGVVLSEVYNHLCCEVELVELARSRHCFQFAERSVVRHLHPVWRTAPDDATYRKGSAAAGEDRLLFNARRHAWQRRVA